MKKNKNKTFSEWAITAVVLLVSIAVQAADEGKAKGPEKELGAEIKSQADAVETEANKIIGDVKTRLQNQAQEEAKKEKELKPGDIRINYVPESVKNEIKQQLRGEVRDQVLDDLIQHAKTERWGLPEAQPEWFSRIKFKGDFRLRGQGDMYSDSNIGPYREDPNLRAGYVDYLKVNENGGTVYTSPDDRYFDTWEDRQRLRARARLGVDAKVSTTTKASFRITTGNTKDPVSTNQTLGQYGNRYTMVWDRAFVEYNGPLSAEHQWLKLDGGRMPNPFFSTDLIWDSDLAFEGLATSFSINLRGGDSLLDITENDQTMFFTMGAFPLQEVALSSRDKWLFGAQLGGHWIFENQSSFKIGLAYYDFTNIQGEKNSLDNTTLNYTAPQYMQKGNLLFDISNDSTDPNRELWALAADYNELALTLSYDYASMAPIHVFFIGEVVKNIGYNKNDIEQRVQGSRVTRSGGFTNSDFLKANTLGYKAAIAVGWPKLTLPGNWMASMAYKYLEADAVVDAFADSDFHLGGTDAKGWIVEYSRGIDENVWLTFKYLSASEITELPFNVDVLQLDVNAKF